MNKADKQKLTETNNSIKATRGFAGRGCEKGEGGQIFGDGRTFDFGGEHTMYNVYIVCSPTKSNIQMI